MTGETLDRRRNAHGRRHDDQAIIEELEKASKLGSAVRSLLGLALLLVCGIGSIAIAGNEAYKNAMQVPEIAKRQAEIQETVKETNAELGRMREELEALRKDLGRYVTDADQDRAEARRMNAEILRRLPEPR